MRFKSIIRRKKISFIIIIGILIFSQKTSSSSLPPGYHTYNEVVDELEEMSSKYSSIATLKTIGKSVEGRPLYAIKISDNPALEEADESDVFYVAEHHAREVITTEIAMEWIRYLLTNYDKDFYVRELVDKNEIWVVPMVNPDGFIKVEGGNVEQRKNTHDVDINRNYGYEWGYDNIGSSNSPQEETYRGPSPFSEPETQAIRDLVESHSFVTSLSWHSGYEAILYPWDYIKEHTPDNDLFRAIASFMSESSGYRYGDSKDGIIYNTNGDLDDWLYGAHHVLAFTVEVYEGPSSDMWQFFNPSTYEMPQIIEKNIQLATLIAEVANNPPKAFVTIDVPKVVYADGEEAIAFAGKVTNRSPEKQSFTLEIKSNLKIKASERSFELSPYQTINIKFEAIPSFEVGEFVEISVSSKTNRNIKNKAILLVESPDRKPPTISDVGFKQVSETSGTITWETDEESQDTLWYGVNDFTDKTETPSTSLHTVFLQNLQPKTTYSFKIRSKDASGNISESSVFQFITADKTPPKISDVGVEVKNREVVIEWKTDESSSSIVRYGKGKDVTESRTNEENTETHKITLDNLSYGTKYVYRIVSVDEFGNASETELKEFETFNIWPSLIISIVAPLLILFVVWWIKR